MAPANAHSDPGPRRRLRVVVLVLALALVASLGWWLLDRPLQERRTPIAAPPATAPAVALPTPSPTKRPVCAVGARKPFTPDRIAIPEVTAGATVVSPPRDSSDVPGTPPLTSTGKQQIAWDRALPPGSERGNVLLNAHTWPDGSALGNRMLAHLEEGDRIVVRGEGKTLCYRVTQRIEVLASGGYPPYYDTDGPPQLAIVVCSGRRLGPGNWTHRTLWFATPI